jgi:hypothetical protein
MRIQYSTLSKYFAALGDQLSERSDIKYAVYYGDFFPYADNEDSYWTVRNTEEYTVIIDRDITLQGQH